MIDRWRACCALLRPGACWLRKRKPGRLRLTALGTLLRAGIPGSLRNLVLLLGGEPAWRVVGRSAPRGAHGGIGFCPCLRHGTFHAPPSIPDRAAVFDAYMADLTRQSAAAILAAHDFSRIPPRHRCRRRQRRPAELHPCCGPRRRGRRVRHPAGIAGARHRLEQAGVVDRCRITAGDFFAAVPEAADAYILKSVLHDWDDDRALRILENCRRAMLPDSVLLDRGAAAAGAHRVLRLPPRDRNDGSPHACDAGWPRAHPRRICELLAAAGLTLNETSPTGSPFAILQAVKAAAGMTSHPRGRGAKAMNRHAILLAGAVLLGLVAQPRLRRRRRQYGPGVSDTEIRIGQTMPYSGRILGGRRDRQGRERLFRMLNTQWRDQRAAGTLHFPGRRYMPPRTLEQTRRLVEQEDVAGNHRGVRHTHERGDPEIP